jgi:RNA polymerase sigma-70 factor (ECF subfamily)
MDDHHPKRRKDKYNPYTINEQGGCYFLLFQDGQSVPHELEIPKALYDLFNAFELRDLSYLNEADRHIEQSELTEAALHKRAYSAPESTEESALAAIENELLHKAIARLPETQRRRLMLYYFGELTYDQIAVMEGCTFQAVAKSVKAAEKTIEKFFDQQG